MNVWEKYERDMNCKGKSALSKAPGLCYDKNGLCHSLAVTVQTQGFAVGTARDCYSHLNIWKRGHTMKNPEITITMEDGGVIRAELYPAVAPNTVKNFLSLAGKGYYDGLIFHRVIKGFMIQGGDPEGTGMGGPGYSIRGEFAQNGFPNDLKHTPGVLSMARSMHPDSAGSQFFLMHKTSPHLDGAYAAFGKVIEGMDIVDKIAETATDYSDRPLEDQVMKTVTVETFGVAYPEPEKL